MRAAGAAGAAGGADMGKLEECLHALIFYYGVWYYLRQHLAAQFHGSFLRSHKMDDRVNSYMTSF